MNTVVEILSCMKSISGCVELPDILDKEAKAFKARTLTLSLTSCNRLKSRRNKQSANFLLYNILTVNRIRPVFTPSSLSLYNLFIQFAYTTGSAERSIYRAHKP